MIKAKYRHFCHQNYVKAAHQMVCISEIYFKSCTCQWCKSCVSKVDSIPSTLQ